MAREREKNNNKKIMLIDTNSINVLIGGYKSAELLGCSLVRSPVRSLIQNTVSHLTYIIIKLIKLTDYSRKEPIPWKPTAPSH